MPVGMFKTKDGYMSVNARRDEHFRRLAKLLGKDEWLDDPRYADARSRVKHRDELMAELRPDLRDEDFRRMGGAAFEHRHPESQGQYVRRISSPIRRCRRSMRCAGSRTTRSAACRWATICGQRPPATGDRLTHSPHVGEHTREILGELGYRRRATSKGSRFRRCRVLPGLRHPEG